MNTDYVATEADLVVAHVRERTAVAEAISVLGGQTTRPRTGVFTAEAQRGIRRIGAEAVRRAAREEFAPDDPAVGVLLAHADQIENDCQEATTHG